MLLFRRNDLDEFRFRHYRSVGITRHTLERKRGGLRGRRSRI